jgi:hypothetical protein
MSPREDWFEKHVVESLDRIEGSLTKVQENDAAQDTRIAVLEERHSFLRTSLFGFLGGVFTLVGEYMTRHWR